MCFLCDGGTIDELHRRIDKAIDDGWWWIQGVEASPGEPAWAYTIGLTANYGHPELVMVDCCCFRCAGNMLNGLGARIALDERFTPGDEVVNDGAARCRIGSVHPDEWATDRFYGWLEYFGSKPWESPPPEAVQVLWRDTSGWQDEPWNVRWPTDCLALPPTDPPGSAAGNGWVPPNRRERRASAQARHHPRRRGPGRP